MADICQRPIPAADSLFYKFIYFAPFFRNPHPLFGHFQQSSCVGSAPASLFPLDFTAKTERIKQPFPFKIHYFTDFIHFAADQFFQKFHFLFRICQEKGFAELKNSFAESSFPAVFSRIARPFAVQNAREGCIYSYWQPFSVYSCKDFEMTSNFSLAV